LKEEELMALLKEIITKIKKQVMGKTVFPKVDHTIEIGHEVVGRILFPKVG